MKMSRVILLIGFLVYVGSFFLIAVKESGQNASGFRGYWCAYTTLQAPWGHSGLEVLREKPLEYFAWLFSGWINPFFLAALVASLIKPAGRLAATLRIVTLLMLPACWLVFHMEHVRPYTGYFLWTGGMLLVLFSSMFSKDNRELKAAGGA